MDSPSKMRVVFGRPQRFRGSLLVVGLLISASGSGRYPAAPSRVDIERPSTARKPTPATPPDSIAVIPFETVSDLIVFDAGIDGIHGKFILDAGAPYVWLSGQYATAGNRGADSATTPNPSAERVPVTVRTLHLGAIHQALDSAGAGPPEPYEHSGAVTNGIISYGDRFEGMTYPAVGSLGAVALEPFETIIDYRHQQLMFIPLDRAGRRLANVSAFTPAASVPLIPGLIPYLRKAYSWAIEATLGGVTDTLLIDTASPVGELTESTLARIAGHVTPGDRPAVQLADHLVVGGRTLDQTPFTGASSGVDLLGAFSLQGLGAVGFNFRTRELLLYR